jgi:hypothetical protein
MRFSSTIAGAAGLVLGQSGNARLLVWVLYNDGRYTVQRLENSAWTTLIPTTSSALVRTTAANRLRAVRRRGHLTMTLNGALLNELDDAGLTEAGVAGLAAVGGNEAGFIARYDDFLARENDPFIAARWLSLDRLWRRDEPESAYRLAVR